ncbi:hypothetical protein QQ045_003290 [Rhodiola kirilowii]
MQIVTTYFGNLVQSSIGSDPTEIDAQLECVSASITEDMNQMLLKEFSEEEIKGVVFSMGPLKAPGGLLLEVLGQNEGQCDERGKLLVKLGFANRWVDRDRVMKCVSSVTYQVRVNDNISSTIRPSKGLRQRDPLSPYLFLLDAKLKLGVGRHMFSGIKICPSAPCVTHLFFADDAILFLKADVEEARHLRDVFNQYEKASG